MDLLGFAALDPYVVHNFIAHRVVLQMSFSCKLPRVPCLRKLGLGKVIPSDKLIAFHVNFPRASVLFSHGGPVVCIEHRHLFTGRYPAAAHQKYLVNYL